MKKRFYPDFYFKSVYDIPDDFFTKNSVRFAVLDIDNTLVPYTVKKPSEQAVAFLKRLDREKIKFCFLSNNNKKRVDDFNENLTDFWISNAKKPLLLGLKKALRVMGAKPEQTVLIGDQVFTDVWCANRAGLKSILVSPIEKKETPFFKFKRSMEKIALKNFKGDFKID